MSQVTRLGDQAGQGRTWRRRWFVMKREHTASPTAASAFDCNVRACSSWFEERLSGRRVRATWPRATKLRLAVLGVDIEEEVQPQAIFRTTSCGVLRVLRPHSNQSRGTSHSAQRQFERLRAKACVWACACAGTGDI